MAEEVIRQNRGNDISEIQQAVNTPAVQEEGNMPEQTSQNPGFEQMQPSLMSPPQEVQYEPTEPQQQYQQPQQYDVGQQYQDYGSAGYDASQYQGGVSSDVISEIAEQVATEKMALITNKLEKAIDFKTVAQTKLENLESRLKRIEQIIDKLQMSLLQKVGDYVNDVSDLKKEMQETQKSFKALLPK